MSFALSRRDFLASTGLACGAVLADSLSSHIAPGAERDDIRPGTGTFKGVVKFVGDVPARTLVIKKDDPMLKPEDRAICAAGDYFSEELIVKENAGNGVANVFVYLQKPPTGYEPQPVPDKPFILDVKICRYSPRAFLLRCGQTFKVKEHDPIPHNAHIVTMRNSGFSEVNGVQVRDAEGFTFTRIFKKPEWRPLPVKCDLHTWMRAYFLVLGHDLAAVTDAGGQFAIKGLPPGKHTFSIWHEKPDWLKKELVVKIKADAVTETALAFAAREFADPE